MSVRSEVNMQPEATNTTADLLAGAVVPPTPAAPTDHVNATISAAQSADSSLGEANTLNTSHPEHPLKRTFVASIRASLADLCLKKSKATWAPTGEALRAILQYARACPLTIGHPTTHTNTSADTCIDLRAGKKSLQI